MKSVLILMPYELSIFFQKLKNLIEILLLESIVFLVMIVLNATLEKQREHIF